MRTSLLGDVLNFARLALAFHRALSYTASRRHWGQLRMALGAEHGFRPLKCEYAMLRAFLVWNARVAAADLEGFGDYDFLILHDGAEVELECKFATEEKGTVTDQAVYRFAESTERWFYEEFRQTPQAVIVRLRTHASFPRRNDDQEQILRLMKEAVRERRPLSEALSVEIAVEEWPEEVKHPGSRVHTLAAEITAREGLYTTAFPSEHAALILAIGRHGEDGSAQSRQFRNTLRSATSQLSGQRPGLVFLEIEGGLAFPPLQRMLRDELTPMIHDLGESRPLLHGVLLGFPGPPFSHGGTFLVRNPFVESGLPGESLLQLVERGDPRYAPFREDAQKVEDEIGRGWQEEWWKERQERWMSATAKALEERHGHGEDVPRTS